MERKETPSLHFLKAKKKTIIYIYKGTYMKNTLKRFICFLLSACVLLSLTSCYVSRYSALMLVRSNAGGKVEIRFSTLDGRLAETFRKKEDGEGALSYTASLEEGELSVSYDTGDGKLLPLFSLKGGESVCAEGGYVEARKGARISIVIETKGKCKEGKIEIGFSQGAKE